MQKNQQKSDLDELPLQQENHHSVQKMDNLLQYNELMKQHSQGIDSQREQQSSPFSLNLYVDMMKRLQISYDANSFQQHLEIGIQYQTKDYEVVVLNVQYGNISTTLTLLNLDQKSYSNCLTRISSGTFGHVYAAFMNGERFALKRIQIFENKFQKTLFSVIREYFLLKIAYSLQIGPKLINIYGFDIIVFRDSIEFSMQFCQDTSKVRKHQISHLSRSLSVLHQLHILHNDIKPQNIAFSPHFNKFVFLDFGLGRIIKQGLGQRTFTSFMGSINYCSKQMEQLFLKGASGYIDLYYNDAFSLSRSILDIVKTGLSFQCSEGEQEVINDWLYELNTVKFYQAQALIFTKSILFDKQMSHDEKVSLFSIFDKKAMRNPSKIVEFMKLLPYSQFSRYLFNNYFKSSICQDYESLSIFRYANEKLFRHFKASGDGQKAQRYRLIVSVKDEIQDQLGMSNIELLSNQKHVLNLDTAAYFLRLSRFIKINGQTSRFQQKIKVCKVYARIHNILHKDHPALYKQTILQIFDYCIHLNHPNNLEIVKQLIQTVIILELVPQERLITIFQQVLQLGIPFIKKIVLAFEFLMGLEFTNQRNKASYDFDQLTEVFMSQLDSQLDYLIENGKIGSSEQAIFYKLKFIIIGKISHLGDIKNASKIWLYSHFQSTPNVIKEREVLCRSIQTYIVCHQKSQTRRLQISQLKQQLQIITKEKSSFKKAHQFSYIDFSYYETGLLRGQCPLTHHVYNKFLAQLQPFEECQHFKINFRHRLQEFRNNFDRVVFRKKLKEDIYSFLQSSEDQIRLFFADLQELMDNNYANCYSEGQTILIQYYPFLKRNQTYMACFIAFIKSNYEKIVSCQYTFHKASLYFHDHRLIIQVFVKFHLLNKALQLNIFNEQEESGKILKSKVFLKKSEQALQKCGCLLCKASCLYSIREMTIKGFEGQQVDEEEVITFICQSICYLLKFSQVNYYLDATIKNLILWYWLRPHLLRRIAIFRFVYHHSIQFKNFSIYLLAREQTGFFEAIYMYIIERQQPEQLLNFLNCLMQYMKHNHCRQIVNSFYFKWQGIFKDRRFSETMIHHQIIENLINDSKRLEKPYLPLFLSAFLQRRKESKFDGKVLYVIKQSLAFVDSQSKNIILSRLFVQVAFFKYFQFSERKMRDLHLKHLKYQFERNDEKYFFRIKLGISEKQRRLTIFWQKLKDCVRRYHANIGNLLSGAK